MVNFSRPPRRYFDIVRADLSKLDDALNFYQQVLEDGMQYVVLQGTLETLQAQTPGLMAYYNQIQKDCSKIKDWLMGRFEMEEAAKYKWFQSSHEAKKEYGDLKSTDIKNFVKADPHLADMADLIHVVDHMEKMLGGLMTGLQQRAMVLSKVTDARVAGVQESWIDSTKETNDE